MRSLWLVVSVLAIANLLALVGVVGWLRSGDRLDRARIEQVRQIFAKTVTQSAAEAEKLKADAAEASKAAEAGEKAARPALTAEDRLQARVEFTEIDRQRAQRLRDENAQLQQSMGEKLAQLESLKEQIAAAKVEFEELTKKTRDTAVNEQFKKTLGVLEALKPDKAKAALKEIMLTGPEGKPQVVSYLNAMDEGVRAKVVQEFLKDDPKLAADLLELLRVRGVPPAFAGAAANDRSR